MLDCVIDQGLAKLTTKLKSLYFVVAIVQSCRLSPCAAVVQMCSLLKTQNNEVRSTVQVVPGNKGGGIWPQHSLSERFLGLLYSIRRKSISNRWKYRILTLNGN